MDPPELDGPLFTKLRSFISRYTKNGDRLQWKSEYLAIENSDQFGYYLANNLIANARDSAIKAEFYENDNNCTMSIRGAESMAWGIPEAVCGILQAVSFYYQEATVNNFHEIYLNGNILIPDSSIFLPEQSTPALVINISNEDTRGDVLRRLEALMSGGGAVRHALHLALSNFPRQPPKPKRVGVAGDGVVHSSVSKEFENARVVLSCVSFTPTGPIHLASGVEIWPRIPSGLLILSPVPGSTEFIPLRLLHNHIVENIGSAMPSALISSTTTSLRTYLRQRVEGSLSPSFRRRKSDPGQFTASVLGNYWTRVVEWLGNLPDFEIINEWE